MANKIAYINSIYIVKKWSKHILPYKMLIYVVSIYGHIISYNIQF